MRALAFCATFAAARALPSSSSAKHNVLFGARLRQLFSLCFGAFFRRADARGAAGCAVLTDDQDILLGSMDPSGPMQKTRKLIIEKGAYFVNGFGATPPAPLRSLPSRAASSVGPTPAPLPAFFSSAAFSSAAFSSVRAVAR